MSSSTVIAQTWSILKTLGSGAFATAYLVQHNSTKQLAVAKITCHKDAKTVQLIENEISCMTRVQGHSNICQLYQVIREKSQTILILEYIQGVDLFKVLEAQGLGHCDVNFVRDVAIQVLSALEFMHSRGVLWRDCKLDNLMITPQGVVKCIDFNLATTFVPGQKLKDACGTPQFASPFVLFAGVFGQDYEADSCIDLHPFAVAMYGLSTGRFPFHSKTPEALLAEQREVSQGLRSIYMPATMDQDLSNLLTTLLKPGQRPTLETTMSHCLFQNAFVSVKDTRPRMTSAESTVTLVNSSASL